MRYVGLTTKLFLYNPLNKFHDLPVTSIYAKFVIMATFTVNTRNEQEKRVLIAFLKSLNYDYIDTDTYQLTEAQQKEVITRDKAYEAGETSARTWNEIKSEF